MNIILNVQRSNKVFGKIRLFRKLLDSIIKKAFAILIIISWATLCLINLTIGKRPDESWQRISLQCCHKLPGTVKFYWKTLFLTLIIYLDLSSMKRHQIQERKHS